MINRRQKLLRGLLACALVGVLTSCSENLAERSVCEAGDGQVSIAWQPLPGIDNYRVFRANDGMNAEPIGEVAGGSFVDTNVQNGTRYGYIVRAVVPDGVEVPDLAACSVVPSPGSGDVGPAAVDDLACRAKNGRVDLAWTPIDGASSYRVLRSAMLQDEEEIGVVSTAAFADFGLVNTTTYRYVVLALDAQGNPSDASNPAECTPAPRGEGTPPPAVAQPSCRAKNDKVDVAWTPVDGAAFYRVFRALGAASPAPIGEVTGNVLADFGLVLDSLYHYSIVAVGSGGAEAAPSPVCDATPSGRADGNRPPVFTSQPLTSALEEHYWYTQLAATDPDDDAITFSLVNAAPGMKQLGSNGFVFWTPGAGQLGPFPVEVRATDARGAHVSQSFVVEVADFNEPPQITSVPLRVTEAGQAYSYDVDAFDPEGGALRFSFGEPAPSGMTIDPTTGVVRWTPGAGDAGQRHIAVRAADPDGGFGEQEFPLDVFAGTLDVLSPKGSFEVKVGETLDLAMTANQPAARLLAYPLPANATSSNNHIVFTPTADQVGAYTIGVKARLGSIYDLERITVRVTRDNGAPVLAAPRPQAVDEGGELTVPIVASDPDGDALVLAPGSPLPTNALFDAVGSRLIFRPSYEQAGHYDIAVSASDGTDTASALVAIDVAEREPPTAATELVIDRVPTPTLQPSVRISGNVVGDPAADPEPQPFIAVNGLAPSAGRQGRSLDIVLSGLNTNFVAEQTTASFGEGITVESVTVLTPTSARARIAIDPAAALGTRVVTVSSDGVAASSIVAFVVEKGAIVFTGHLIDSFTQQPIVGARVVVNGTSIEGVTDAQGNFSIEGVPPGAQQIVIATDNYDLRRIDLVFEPGTDLALDEHVALDALARPFQPGGSLPRAANVASVLDRGVAGGDQSLTQEQAEALVLDTLLAVGGTLVGVLDESGGQLNPQIGGNGLLSIRPEGVGAQAAALMRGDRVTLGEIARNLSLAFDWGDYAPDEGALIVALQRYADAGWANPGDPLNAMALILLNEGTSLSPRPPRVSAATSFNRFQTFLLVTSILLPSASSIESSLEPFLRDQNIDLDAIDQRYALAPLGSARPAWLTSALTAVSRGLDWLGPQVAHAQDGQGVVIPPPNDYFDRSPFRSQSFTRLVAHAANSFIAEATVNNAMSALVAASIQATIAYTVGATGGAVGIAAATGYVSALVSGLWGAALDKLVIGLAIAAAADSVEPTPPIPERSFIDANANKLVIEFDASTTDQANDSSNPIFGVDPLTAFAHHTYELFDFKDAFSTDVRDAIVISTATLARSLENESKLQFSIPLGAVPSGVHYYRMATVQYQSVSDHPLNQARIEFPYQIQPGTNPPTTILELVGGDAKPSEFFKARYDLNDTIRNQINAQVQVDIAARYGPGISSFEDLTHQRTMEINALAELSEETSKSTAAAQDSFDALYAKKKVKAEGLTKLATDIGKDPSLGLESDLDHPESRVARKAETFVKELDANDGISPATRERMKEISLASTDAELGSLRSAKHQESETKLREHAAKIARNEIDLSKPENRTFTFDSFDENGSPGPVTRQLPEDPNAARSVLLGDATDQKNKVVVAADDVRSANRRHRDSSHALFGEEIGPASGQHERNLSEFAERQAQLEARAKAAEKDLHKGKFERRKRESTKTTTRQLTKYAPAIKNGVRFFGVVSEIANWQERISDIVNGLSVIYSKFSAAFRYLHVQRDIPPFSVETHPNLQLPDGVVVGEKDPANTRGGFLTNVFGDSGDSDERREAGFPPEFLAVDSEAYIYTHNGNSGSRFGGRIFRFYAGKETKTSIEREFVGSVNYYSTTLQYAQPASPVAMTTGTTFYTGRPLEALFIADIQYVGAFGAGLETPRPVLKQLPIELMRDNGPYADASVRNHFVGQEVVADPRWQFTGPTDLANYADAVRSRTYVSDEEGIYVVSQSLVNGSIEVLEVLHETGRRWGGLSFDLAATPNFYFCDYESGDVFYVKLDELLLAENPGRSLAEFARPLTNLGARKVYDIEIDQEQHHLLGSTREGIIRQPMPVVVRSTPGGLRATVVRLAQEYLPLQALGLNGDLFQILPVAAFEIDRGRLRMGTRQPAGAVGATGNLRELRLAPAGPTEVDLR